MAKTTANSNFHTATKTSVFDAKLQDGRFKEYRKRWFEYPKQFITGDFPIHLDIEATSLCNLSCPFCASTYDNWGPGKKGFMEFDLFKRIIDEGASRGLFSIKLSLRGEPLLHKGIPEMVSYAKKKGIIDIYFNTNAVLLNDEIIEKLVDSGLDRISISFEGTTKEVYEKYRVGARFEEVLANIKNLKKIRDLKKRANPKIRVQTVLLPELKDSFDDYVKFWSALADEVSYLDARDEKTVNDRDAKKGGALISDWACPFLWQRMMILWDGTVMPCLMHGVKDFSEMVLGNASKDPLRDMWKSEKLDIFRDLHRAGSSHEITACKNCSYRTMEVKKGKK